LLACGNTIYVFKKSETLEICNEYGYSGTNYLVDIHFSNAKNWSGGCLITENESAIIKRKVADIFKNYTITWL